MSWYIKNDGNYLCHYGTKNMKWGVRKYQNEDGTLTAAGKERYKNMMPSSAREAQRDAELKRRQDKNRSSNKDDYNTFLFNHGYDKQHNPEKSYLFERSMADEQSKFRDFCKGKSRDEMAAELDRKYEFDKLDYGKDIADQIRQAKADIIRVYDSERQMNDQKRKKAEGLARGAIQGRGSMPTSAIKARNYAAIKSKIPASAWNQMIKAN